MGSRNFYLSFPNLHNSLKERYKNVSKYFFTPILIEDLTKKTFGKLITHDFRQAKMGRTILIGFQLRRRQQQIANISIDFPIYHKSGVTKMFNNNSSNTERKAQKACYQKLGGSIFTLKVMWLYRRLFGVNVTIQSRIWFVESYSLLKNQFRRSVAVTLHLWMNLPNLRIRQRVFATFFSKSFVLVKKHDDDMAECVK